MGAENKERGISLFLESDPETGKPAVSVIVPVYQAQDYIMDCVDSILAQTDKDYELLPLADDPAEAVAALTKQYYLTRGAAPKQILLSPPISGSSARSLQ